MPQIAGDFFCPFNVMSQTDLFIYLLFCSFHIFLCSKLQSLMQTVRDHASGKGQIHTLDPF